MRQLQVAAEQYNAKHPDRPLALDLRFHPFQLGGPGKFTETPISRAEYMEKNYGADRTKQFAANFDKQYRELGLAGL